MPNQNVRRCLARCVQQSVEFFRHNTRHAWFRAGITPSISATIVGADPRELGDLRLYKIPIQIRALLSILENYGLSFARASQVETIAADVHQLSGRGIKFAVAPFCPLFIQQADCREKQKRDQLQTDDNTSSSDCVMRQRIVTDSLGNQKG